MITAMPVKIHDRIKKLEDHVELLENLLREAKKFTVTDLLKRINKALGIKT